MPFVQRSTLMTLIVLSVVALLAAASFVLSGVYNVGADDAHTRPVHLLLQTLRERSIEQRARGLDLPPLDDVARIRQGAGNYDAMCSGCHLTPGVGATELSRGLNPAPPKLAVESVPPREAFWAIKHGVKASGMPAWGKSMEDDYIWNMVAFLQKLPNLDAAQYREMVAASGGHSHGGSESSPHSHGHAEMNHPAVEQADAAKPHSHMSGDHSDVPPSNDEMSQEHQGHEVVVPANPSTVPAHGEPSHHH